MDMGEEMRVDGGVFLKRVIPWHEGPSYRPLGGVRAKMRTAYRGRECWAVFGMGKGVLGSF